MFTWFNGSTLLMLIICPVLSLVLVGQYNARIVRRCQKRRDILSAHGGTSGVRWSAGTRLRLTEDLYPWHEGDVVVLALDWMSGSTTGRVAAGRGPLDYMIPLESVEVV